MVRWGSNNWEMCKKHFIIYQSFGGEYKKMDTYIFKSNKIKERIMMEILLEG